MLLFTFMPAAVRPEQRMVGRLKRIDDGDAAQHASALAILGQEQAAAVALRRRPDHRVPERELVHPDGVHRVSRSHAALRAGSRARALSGLSSATGVPRRGITTVSPAIASPRICENCRFASAAETVRGTG